MQLGADVYPLRLLAGLGIRHPLKLPAEGAGRVTVEPIEQVLDPKQGVASAERSRLTKAPNLRWKLVLPMSVVVPPDQAFLPRGLYRRLDHILEFALSVAVDELLLHPAEVR